MRTKMPFPILSLNLYIFCVKQMNIMQHFQQIIPFLQKQKESCRERTVQWLWLGWPQKRLRHLCNFFPLFSNAVEGYAHLRWRVKCFSFSFKSLNFRLQVLMGMPTVTTSSQKENKKETKLSWWLVLTSLLPIKSEISSNGFLWKESLSLPVHLVLLK